MFKQLDIDYNKVTINGVEFLKPVGLSSTDWLNAWETARLSFEDPNYIEDAFEGERKEYKDQVYDLDCQVEALEDKVSDLERELVCADDEISELQDLVKELQTK